MRQYVTNEALVDIFQFLSQKKFAESYENKDVMRILSFIQKNFCSKRTEGDVLWLRVFTDQVWKINLQIQYSE